MKKFFSGKKRASASARLVSGGGDEDKNPRKSVRETGQTEAARARSTSTQTGSMAGSDGLSDGDDVFEDDQSGDEYVFDELDGGDGDDDGKDESDAEPDAVEIDWAQVEVEEMAILNSLDNDGTEGEGAVADTVALKARIHKQLHQDELDSFFVKHERMAHLSFVLDALMDLDGCNHGVGGVLMDFEGGNADAAMEREFPHLPIYSIHGEESVLKCRAFLKPFYFWRCEHTLGRIIDCWLGGGSMELAAENKVLVEQCDNLDEEGKAAMDAVYEFVLDELKSQLDARGLKQGSDYLLKLQYATVDRVSRVLCKFAEWLVIMNPFDEAIVKAEFWSVENTSKLVSEYLQYYAWEAGSTRQKALKGFRVRKLAAAKAAGAKKEGRLSDDKLKAISTTQSGAAVASVRVALGVALTVLGIYEEGQCHLLSRAGARSLTRKVNMNKAKLESAYWPICDVDVYYYLDHNQPSTIREMQEAVMMLMWVQLGSRKESFFSLHLENLTFGQLKTGRPFVKVVLSGHKTEVALLGDEQPHEIVQTRIKHDTYNYLLAYLKMRHVVQENDEGTPSVMADCRKQALFLAGYTKWLLADTQHAQNGGWMRKFSTRIGVDRTRVAQVSFRKGKVLSIFLQCLAKDARHEITFDDIKAAIVTEGYWENRVVGAGYLNYGEREVKKGLHRWRSDVNSTPTDCIRFLHELVLDSDEFVKPGDPIIDVITQQLTDYWLKERKSHIQNLNELKDRLENEEADTAIVVRVESAIEREAECMKILIPYRRLQASDLVNRAKIEILDVFNTGPRYVECTDLTLSFEQTSRATPCLAHHLSPLRSQFRNFDPSFCGGPEPIRCMVKDCEEVFNKVMLYQKHRQAHAKEIGTGTLTIVCRECDLEYEVPRKRDQWKSVTEHYQRCHHLNMYCVDCEEWKQVHLLGSHNRSQLCSDGEQCLDNDHYIVDPAAITLQYATPNERQAYDGYCIGEKNWRDFVPDELRSHIEDYNLRQFVSAVLGAYRPGEGQWPEWASMPNCIKSSMKDLFNGLL